MKDISPKLLKFAIRSLAVLSVLLAIFLTYYYIVPALNGLLKYLTPIFLPFILAMILAALIDPLVDYFQLRFKLNRGMSVLLVISVIIGGLIAGVSWLITLLIIELVRLSSHLPRISVELTHNVIEIVNKTTAFYFSLDIPQEIIENATADIQRLVSQLSQLTGQVLSNAVSFLSSIPGGLLVLIFTLMATFFFSRDRDKIRKGIYKLLPERSASLLDSVTKEIGSAMVGFIRAQFILMSITFLQTIAGLYLLDIQYALLIAIFVGLVDALPILGPGAVFVPWIAWLFLAGDFRLAFALLILYAFITIVRQVLQPKIVGDNVGMHPLEALFALYGGLKAFGVLGVVIGPVVLVALKAIWRGWKK